MRPHETGRADRIAVRNARRHYDRRTGLTWMRCNYGQACTESGGCSGEVKLLDWDAAIRLRLPGNIAWRLRQKDELESIVATNCKRPAIDETVFPDTPSSSVLDGHADRAVVCRGSVLSNRHVDVECPPHDALCCSAGATRPMNEDRPRKPIDCPWDRPRRSQTIEISRRPNVGQDHRALASIGGTRGQPSVCSGEQRAPPARRLYETGHQHKYVRSYHGVSFPLLIFWQRQLRAVRP